MALTKKDLGMIGELFTKLFSQEFVKVYELILSPRFDRLEDRMEKVEDRLGNVEDRLGNVEDRLDGVEDRLDGVEDRLDGVEGKLTRLEKKGDDNFFNLKDQIDDNTKLIGYYFEKCATKEELNVLSGRVAVLEAA